jgi:hypothetical protein
MGDLHLVGVAGRKNSYCTRALYLVC